MPLGASRASILSGGIQGGSDLPTHSINGVFASGDLQLRSTASASPGSNISPTFASMDYQKLGFSRWIKNANSSTICIAGDGSFYLVGGTNSVYSVIQWSGAGAITLDATPLTLADGSWHHIYVKIDSTQAAPEDRYIVYYDGVATHTYDGMNTCDLNDSIDAMGFAAWEDAYVEIYGAPLSAPEDKVYQSAIFSGTLPDIGDLYDMGSPVDISALPGLFSYIDNTGGNLHTDSVMALTWVETGMGSLEATTDIPS